MENSLREGQVTNIWKRVCKIKGNGQKSNTILYSHGLSYNTHVNKGSRRRREGSCV